MGGGVGVWDDTARGEGLVEICDVEAVAVGEEDGDDFLRVLVEPFFDDFEIVGEEARVFHEAVGVAET